MGITMTVRNNGSESMNHNGWSKSVCLLSTYIPGISNASLHISALELGGCYCLILALLIQRLNHFLESFPISV